MNSDTKPQNALGNRDDHRHGSPGPRCARCSLDLAAWRVDVAGVAFCSSYCAHAAGYLDAHDDERPAQPEAP